MSRREDGAPDAGAGNTGADGAGDTGAGDTGAGDTGAGDTGAGDTGAGDTGAGDGAGGAGADGGADDEGDGDFVPGETFTEEEIQQMRLDALATEVGTWISTHGVKIGTFVPNENNPHLSVAVTEGLSAAGAMGKFCRVAFKHTKADQVLILDDVQLGLMIKATPLAEDEPAGCCGTPTTEGVAPLDDLREGDTWGGHILECDKQVCLW